MPPMCLPVLWAVTEAMLEVWESGTSKSSPEAAVLKVDHHTAGLGPSSTDMAYSHHCKLFPNYTFALQVPEEDLGH